MNKILILGSGRSGTSMLTGMLASSGFHLGDDFEYLNKNKANPKGFFEDYEVNTVNEDILKATLVNLPEFLRQLFLPSSTFYRARWLARLSKKKSIKTTLQINDRVRYLVHKDNFCYKDPRLSYTLPIWQSVMHEEGVCAKYIVVYREPSKTSNSIVRECIESKALHPLKMNSKKALQVWELMYSHILQNYKKDKNKKDWLFVHFNQLFEIETLKRIESFVGVVIDKEFPDKKLSRAQLKEEAVNLKISLIYDKLNELSLYT